MKTMISLLFAAALIAAIGAARINADQSAANLTIHMTDSLFKPDTAQAKVGETVRFVNDDAFPHTVTGGADDKSLDSKDIAGGRTWTYTFTKPGTYTYVCVYHSWMKGKIVVTP